MKRLAILALIGTGLSLVGCGGGAGGSSSSGPGGTNPTGSSQTTTVGNASITYQGALRANVSAIGANVTSVGVAGANISAMSFYPTNNLADTNILYRDKNDIYSYSLRTFATTDITHSAYPSEWPAVSSNGVVAFVRYDPSGGYNIWTSKPDGSNQVQITKGANSYTSLSISSNGTLFSAFDVSANIYRITTSGVATKILTNSASINAQPYYGAAWSPDNTRVVFFGNGGLYTVPVSGGNPTLIYGGTVQLQFASWSADSSQIVATDGEQVYVLSSTGPSTQALQPAVGTTSTAITGAAFSPDGRRIAYVDLGASTKGVYTCDPNGANVSFVASLVGPMYTPVAWSGFLPPENMIGSGGIMNTPSASGVVVSTGTKGFGSVVSFIANTPSSATVVGSSSTQGPIGFTVSADSITSVTWMNSYFGPPSQKTLTSTPQLLFVVDGSSGTVSFVAPAVDAKTSKISKVVKGSSVVYSGRFTSVFDAQGNNIAPNGANAITVDATTKSVTAIK